MERLFVYGTLRPGHANAYILENIGGEWVPGYVTGMFYESGWGAATGFPGLILDEQGAHVGGYLFLSNNLEAHWTMLDEFEEGYDRVEVVVTTAEGQQVTAWVYQLQPQQGQ
ncbi:gamma-glutamylcyclotransferase family protein [Pectobacterium aroidearum]|uniref:gamma-glutamylcyclotransferase family protein n=1 Tax=Pectobacterium aroidearum TaxID=1201031 RepID=UPI00301844D9